MTFAFDFGAINNLGKVHLMWQSGEGEGGGGKGDEDIETRFNILGAPPNFFRAPLSGV